MVGCFCFSDKKKAEEGDKMNADYKEQANADYQADMQRREEEAKQEEERKEAEQRAQAEKDAAEAAEREAAEAAAREQAEREAAEAAAREQAEREAAEAAAREQAEREAAEAAAREQAEREAAEKAAAEAAAAEAAKKNAAPKKPTSRFQRKSTSSDLPGMATGTSKKTTSKTANRPPPPSFGPGPSAPEWEGQECMGDFMDGKTCTSQIQQNGAPANYYYDNYPNHGYQQYYDTSQQYRHNSNISQSYLSERSYSGMGSGQYYDTGYGYGYQPNTYTEVNVDNNMAYSFLPTTTFAYDNFGNLIQLLNATQPTSSFMNQVPIASYTPHPNGGILAYDEDGNAVQFTTDQVGNWGVNESYSRQQSKQDSTAAAEYYQSIKAMIASDKKHSKAPDLVDNGENLPKIDVSYKPPSVNGKVKKSKTKKEKTTKATKTPTKETEPRVSFGKPIKSSTSTDEAILLPKNDGSYDIVTLEEYSDLVQNSGFKGTGLQVNRNDETSIKYALYVAQRWRQQDKKESPTDQSSQYQQANPQSVAAA